MSQQRDIKAAVAAAFSAAADTYDDGAEVQREVAERLALRIARLKLPPRARILEIGCGTGFLTRALARIDARELVITDIAPAMLARCRINVRDAAPETAVEFLVMDGEKPCVEGPFDLICASLAFQWFADLPRSLNGLAGLLAPGGHLAFATLAADSFQEWRNAHRTAGLQAGTHLYPLARDLADMLPGMAVTEDRLGRRYADGVAFVEHLKQIGAHMAEDNRRLGAGALRSVLRRFEAGIEVTYHVAYGTWSKP
jgi:malonyl-ACP O-methyltransferase BioC